jgi:hypothetical protein
MTTSPVTVIPGNVTVGAPPEASPNATSASSTPETRYRLVLHTGRSIKTTKQLKTPVSLRTTSHGSKNWQSPELSWVGSRNRRSRLGRRPGRNRLLQRAVSGEIKDRADAATVPSAGSLFRICVMTPLVQGSAERIDAAISREPIDQRCWPPRVSHIQARWLCKARTRAVASSGAIRLHPIRRRQSGT